jgi:hypothetical protein
MKTASQRRLLFFAGTAGALAFASSSFACTATANSTSAVGPYSPAAIKAGAVPALYNYAGLNCSSALLILLGGNYIHATFSSANGFKLKPPSGTDVITYTASADSGATVPITQGATVDYMQNNLLNLLGLLGGSTANLPFYVKPSSTNLVTPGTTYTDLITINWDWHMCTGIGALGACIGTLDSGTTTTKVTVSLSVSANPPVVTIASASSWDPVNTTFNPKAVPGSKQRMTANVANPDIVTLGADSVVVALTTPSGMAIALDGDGTGGSVVRLTQGSPASNLTLTYTSASSATDDVDFSANNGTTWTYAPDASSDASMAAVTNIRFRMKGSMAASSSFNVSVPYKVK